MVVESLKRGIGSNEASSVTVSGSSTGWSTRMGLAWESP